MQHFHLVWLIALPWMADAFSITSQPTPTLSTRGTHVKAVIPTTSGQIGINPVLSDLGDPATYVGEIYGTDTKYITIISTSTKWIGVNTQYLSLETINPTSTSTIKVVIATATAAANGQSVGDLSIILPEGFAGALQDSATAGVKACNAVPAKLRRWNNGMQRRQVDSVLTCLLGYATTDAKDGALFDTYLGSDAFVDFPAGLAEGASAVLQAGIKGLAAKESAKILMWLAVASTVIRVISEAKRLGITPVIAPIAKINIPASGFASPIPPPKTGCTTGAQVNINSPLCVDSDCQGVNNICIIDGSPNKNCPCLQLIPDPVADYLLNQTILNLQQDWLNAEDTLPDVATTSTATASITTTSTATTPTSCIFTSSVFLSQTTTARYCTCGTWMAEILLAVSGTSTTSYCATGGGLPPGWTQIPADINGYPVSTNPATPSLTPKPSPKPTPKPTPTPLPAPPPSPKATATYCDPYWCGAPFCGACP